MKKLPPLNALRSFCAVGQYQSIARAAAELGVSASAVSQQIKALESWMGIQLFIRGKSSVELTAKGATYYAQVWQSLSMIEEATSELRGDDSVTNLTISVLPSFASLWLVPRLIGFKTLYPDVDVSILTTNDLVDFSAGEVDIAVRYGQGDYPNLTSRKLMSEAINVVCTPKARDAYIQKYGGVENLEGLAEVHFIDDVGPNVGFKSNVSDWLHQNGLSRNALNYAYRFTDSHIAIENMISQNLFMLARLSLVENRLDAGTVVAPFGPWSTESAAYYVVHPDHMTLRPVAKLFVKWLSKECAQWDASRVLKTPAL
ncbi:LysR family glycine cleavage system transcriptional activator [Loktanella ponticola]|uniref:LysR family glycine cleavage system transcriptional activator n=1 Tax=Yoonia ponticola TaxID=1524255 RepID=A0A7W9BHI0_9RHOB|nr:LysR substrate-binding domain-containing protein [Yoonia ponticola]MBB5720604.1 LysR family glycine cleavage system transcriptional activator [Yoonia ponticola]